MNQTAPKDINPCHFVNPWLVEALRYNQAPTQAAASVTRYSLSLVTSAVLCHFWSSQCERSTFIRLAGLYIRSHIHLCCLYIYRPHEYIYT